MAKFGLFNGLTELVLVCFAFCYGYLIAKYRGRNSNGYYQTKPLGEVLPARSSPVQVTATKSFATICYVSNIPQSTLPSYLIRTIVI
jgi:hypothetical protein